MKKTLLLITLVLVGITATAQVKVGTNPTTLAANANFQVEGTTTADQFIVLKNGNVGIGTTAPTEALQISSGNVRINGEDNGLALDDPSFAPRLGIVKKSGNFPMIVSDSANPILFAQSNQAGVLTNIASATLTERMRIDGAGNVGIGTTAPNTSSLLDVDSTTKGFLPPRMTTAQRDAITSPAKGLVLYNTTLDCLQVNKGTSVVPVWECIGASASASLIIDCVASRFALSSTATDPLCTGLFIGTSGYQVKVLLINNSFTAVSALDLSTALALTGTGAAGLTVTAGQNSNVSVGGGSSATITYNLSGAPTTAGAITATFNRLSLSCVINNTVANQATWAGNGLNGTSAVNANYSCLAIKNAFPASANGVYWIDPDASCTVYNAMQAQCDMTTDGGGWTLVMNYLHRGGTNPALVSTGSLPLLTSSTLGVDESGIAANWKHANTALLGSMTFTTIRFEGKTSNHSRILHFKTSHAGTINMYKTGTGSASGIQSNFTALSGHTSFLPVLANNFAVQELPGFAFFGGGAIYTAWPAGGQWEMDDDPNNNLNNTLHRAWVK